MGNNLKPLRNGRGWTHEKAAEAMGISRSQFIKLERGERKLTERTISLAANAFGVSEADVIAEQTTVPLVGFVGAGAMTHRFSDGQGELERIPAPEGSTQDTVAVEIRGESLGSFFDQWLVFYDEVRTPPTSDMIGKLCVCGLSDGRVLIKKLKRGKVEKSWTLLSQMEEPIYDAFIDWCARVRRMEPRR